MSTGWSHVTEARGFLKDVRHQGLTHLEPVLLEAQRDEATFHLAAVIDVVDQLTAGYDAMAKAFSAAGMGGRLAGPG